MQALELLINKVDSFPTLPTIYTSLLEATSNPRSTVQDVANILMQDQSSVSKLLKVINSPLYGLSSKITSISQAIMLLGFTEVKNVILALSIVDLFSSTNKDLAVNMVEMWKHSIAVGVISRILGVNLKVGIVENYFVAGLIHDIGKLFFITTFKENYVQVVQKAREDNASLYDYEQKVFGMNHDTVGELLANKWDLPECLTVAIKYHHSGADGKLDALASCVHLANIMAKCMNLGESFETTINQPNFEIWNTLNFSNGVLTSLYDQITEAFNQSASILILNK
jgi:HD-like signal output (HDOD) protein